MKRLKIFIIILLLSKICFAQKEFEVMGYNFLVPNQSDEWIKKNEISKIFELEYSPSDTLNFYLVNEFNFDSNGYLINKGQSSVNYKWNNCEHFRYSYEDKYVFNKKDSFLLVLQYTIRYDTVKCFVNGKEVIYKPDTLKPTTEIWNKYKLKCYKSNMIEHDYTFNERGNITQLIKRSLSINIVVTINFIYKDTLIIQVLEKTSGFKIKGNGVSMDQRKWDYTYDTSNDIIEIRESSGSHENNVTRYYYDNKHYLIKKELYFNNKLADICRYIYDCK